LAKVSHRYEARETWFGAIVHSFGIIGDARRFWARRLFGVIIPVRPGMLDRLFPQSWVVKIVQRRNEDK
jgi:hypothetical protein